MTEPKPEGAGQPQPEGAGQPQPEGPQPKPAGLVGHHDCGRHDTGWGHPEHQGRLPAIIRALERDTPALLDHVLQHEASPATEGQLLRVHSHEHVRRVHEAGLESEQTGELVGLDGDTVMSPASWDAALASAGCAIDAVSLVLDGRALHALALSRPPGHHATRDLAMGFCLFNNVAVATRCAQTTHGVERVLIIDWDVHHGNGTQDIFYDDASVYYLSLHIDGHYPGTGAADERGCGAGAGATLNVPVAAGTPAADYLRLFDEALDRAFAESRPQLVLVSAGYDCLAGDPLGGLLLEPPDIHRMTGRVLEHAAELEAPVVAVLEGGYAPPRTGAGVVATMRALAGIAWS
ncbi:MAG TPA: histone deacetylase [Longimicrobiales bacterium]|nr:histone deacetylase [Longimicrobiales bacterium]